MDKFIVCVKKVLSMLYSAQQNSFFTFFPPCLKVLTLSYDHINEYQSIFKHGAQYNVECFKRGKFCDKDFFKKKNKIIIIIIIIIM